jgi:hypothetical protein
LSFERYEQRIALSTNATGESGVTDYLFKPTEGGAIQLSFANSTISLRNVALTSHVFTGSAWDRPATASGSMNSSAPWLSPQGDFLGHYDVFDGDIANPEVLVTDSQVVPIPPPPIGQVGGEGGQIPMTAFIGPSTLGLTDEDPALLASRSRAAVEPETLETSPGATNSSPTDALRGRAVVYEVAQVTQDLSDTSDAKLNVPAQVSGEIDRPLQSQISHLATASEGATAENHDARPATPNVASLAAAHETRANELVDAAAKIVKTRASVADFAVAAADDFASQAGGAAAHDAALTAWEERAEAADLDSEVALTIDVHQRRMISGALIAVAAVPVTKALWRRRQQQSIEQRPRQRAFEALYRG